MQDNTTGDMEMLKSLSAEDIEKCIFDPKDRGPIFTIGEELMIKGGRFKVKTFGKRFIQLEGLPKNNEVCMLCAESKRTSFNYCSHCGRDLKYYP